jgi:hypothetical protein
MQGGDHYRVRLCIGMGFGAESTRPLRAKTIIKENKE